MCSITTITLIVGTHKWGLVYKLIINDNIVKCFGGNRKCVFREVITVDIYFTLINTYSFVQRTLYILITFILLKNAK